MKQDTYPTQKPLQKAAVIHVEMPLEDSEKPQKRAAQARLDEAVNLCEALSGVEIVCTESLNLNKINPKMLIGGGKVEELAALLASYDANVAVINAKLSPSQQRNLEIALDCKVIDRTGLILEIFAERARTKAGRLQVELAQLNYQASRLVRSWTHLERQRGGLGKTGGPGERQIELDRRLLNDNITKIQRELSQVEKERNLHRRARDKAGTPVVALVGYTNAGKSTLFNAMVGADAMAKDMLFATLDPLMRKLELPSGREVIFSDTVGFISDLPHELVEAFKATLEEVVNADILLQVHDLASDEVAAQADDVVDVLRAIGADHVPTIHVLNKVDLLDDISAEAAQNQLTGDNPDNQTMRTSAITGLGIEALIEQIDETLAKGLHEVELEVPFSNGRAYAWLHAHGEILSEEMDDDTHAYRIRVRLSDADLGAYRLL